MFVSVCIMRLDAQNRYNLHLCPLLFTSCTLNLCLTVLSYGYKIQDVEVATLLSICTVLFQLILYNFLFV